MPAHNYHTKIYYYSPYRIMENKIKYYLCNSAEWNWDFNHWE